jgi:hypothetical protein
VGVLRVWVAAPAGSHRSPDADTLELCSPLTRIVVGERNAVDEKRVTGDRKKA